jgi:hypothetical protein
MQCYINILLGDYPHKNYGIGVCFSIKNAILFFILNVFNYRILHVGIKMFCNKHLNISGFSLPTVQTKINYIAQMNNLENCFTVIFRYLINKLHKFKAAVALS